MKKVILLAAFLAGSIASVQAQKIKAGLKIGASFTQLSGDDWQSDAKANALGGIFLSASALRFGVHAEALFSQGSYMTASVKAFPSAFYSSIQDSLKQGSFRVNYLSIPVLFQAKVAGPLWLQAGPQFSGIVSVNDKNALVKDAKSLFKSGSVDAVLGVWLNLPAHINAGARAVFGLSNISDVQGANDNWKQRAYQLHIGYTF
jgi:hypothetical protein